MKYVLNTLSIFSVLALVMAMTSCSASKFIPEGESLLDRVSIVSDSAAFNTSSVSGYVRQYPNSKWFSLFRAPLAIYSLSGIDSAKRINRFLQRMGEAPVIYDEEIAKKTQMDMVSAVKNMGYLQASVDLVTMKKKKKKIQLVYYIHPREQYSVRRLDYQIPDTAIYKILTDNASKSLLSEGMPFNLNILENERTRISALLQNYGYYYFNKDYLHYQADTTVGNKRVDIRMILKPFKTKQNTYIPHVAYRLGTIKYETEGNLSIKHKVLNNANELVSGDLYSEEKVHNTYSNLMRLGTVVATNIRMTPDAYDSDLLNTTISLTPGKLNTLNLELEGTNSAGDLGAAVSSTYTNRNLFHGGEFFNVKVRGAFEAIRGLNGYSDQDYIEYSVQSGITFPSFKFPFLTHKFRKIRQATTEVSLMYDSQDRPEFHRRVVTTALRYRWNHYNRKIQHKIDLLDLNYVFMPWISDTFRKLYLEDPNSKNAILKYNYENLFIMKSGYNYTYSSRPLLNASNNYGTNAYIIRTGVETSGCLLYAMSHLFHASRTSDNQYTLFNIAYAQYIKGDFDFSKSFKLDEKNSFAIHFGIGCAYPYGNSRILPYEKRYFSGGANSVRGWSVRGLGPGSFKGTDGRIDFINQTGDLKLDMNVEFRTHLFWKLHGAAFVDAGNIWTLRDYKEQPGGQFKFDTFWRQIAVAYGLGLRLNFDYFILRFDVGMKAVDPAYTDFKKHVPLLHPNLRNDMRFHFAVGLPF